MAITLIVEQAAQHATDTNQIDQFKRLCREEAETFMRWANDHPAVGNDPEGAVKLRLCYLDLGGIPELRPGECDCPGVCEDTEGNPGEVPSHTPSINSANDLLKVIAKLHKSHDANFIAAMPWKEIDALELALLQRLKK